MARFLLLSGFALVLLGFLAPASAQYRFDRTVDPIECHWQEVCDYGGRAIIRAPAWRARYPIVEMTHELPDGRVVIERRRDCGNVLRLRG
jgi:hypothetical protein